AELAKVRAKHAEDVADAFVARSLRLPGPLAVSVAWPVDGRHRHGVRRRYREEREGEDQGLGPDQRVREPEHRSRRTDEGRYAGLVRLEHGPHLVVEYDDAGGVQRDPGARLMADERGGAVLRGDARAVGHRIAVEANALPTLQEDHFPVGSEGGPGAGVVV